MARREEPVRPLRLEKGSRSSSRPAGPRVAYVGIGSNQGDRLALCREALRLLEAGRPGAKSAVRIKKISSLYETEPMEYLDQDRFYNAVVEIETTLPPLRLLKQCQKIENRLGKKIEIPKGPRTIDLDLLFYDQKIIDRPGLILPHPAAASRPFVLVPLAEIAPGFLDPRSGESASALLGRLPSGFQIVKKHAPGWEREEKPGRKAPAAALPRARSRSR
ncbi:MAG TPA: 2-amino-4-hydroxy-6-hydroxymethyldihydropteridine diphosphokinase [Candidatus Manganitrophaceae bacterium]|nr:2-amino-4-hydroxy-6-hydroxymethyldihydropteridine diphosphokinase [Candidatus Manganitrophaceae bacterium]